MRNDGGAADDDDDDDTVAAQAAVADDAEEETELQTEHPFHMCDPWRIVSSSSSRGHGGQEKFSWQSGTEGEK